MAKFLPLMRVGVFQDRHGKNYGITRAVLEKIAETFNPSKPPHLLVGHPDSATAPSFGIVEALKVVGDKLMFKPGKVCAEFAALVRRGGFPSVSAGLTRDLARLDHVAFLSAQKSAIDGLEPIAEFASSAEGGTVGIEGAEFAEMAEFGVEDWLVQRLRAVGDLLRGVKNFVIERTSAEEADRLISEYQLASLQEGPPVGDDADETGGEFAAQVDRFEFAADGTVKDYKALYDALLPQFAATSETIAAHEKANVDLTARNVELVERVAELEKQARLAEFAAFAEGQIAEGRVLPDQKESVVSTMEALYSSAGAEFSSGDAAPEALDVYKKDILARPRVAPPAGAAAAPQFSAGVDATDGAELGKRARAYAAEMAAKGVTVNAIDAVAHLTRNN